jgi:hypothetical protein
MTPEVELTLSMDAKEERVLLEDPKKRIGRNFGLV